MSLTTPLLFFLIHIKYMTTAVTDEDTTDVTVKVTATDIPTGTLYEHPDNPDEIRREMFHISDYNKICHTVVLTV